MRMTKHDLATKFRAIPSLLGTGGWKVTYLTWRSEGHVYPMEDSYIPMSVSNFKIRSVGGSHERLTRIVRECWMTAPKAVYGYHNHRSPFS